MKFGLSTENYRFIKSLLKKLEEKGAKIFCFGSRARGDFRKFSDLDLMVEGDSNLSSAVGELEEIFEESDLPIKVDIVELRHFAKDYLEGYQKDKVVF